MDILMIVDYQNDFVTGSLGFDGADSIDEGIAEAIEKAYGQGAKIIVTRDTHFDNYLNTQEGRKLPIKHCIKCENGWEIFGKTAKALRERDFYCIDKETFGSITLGDVLQSIDIDEKVKNINICGVVTNMCVISNAVIAKAACPEAEINILEHLCLSNDKELHKKAIDVMASMQMNIKDNF